jgi:type II secretory pathway pseudopilin PulG
MVPEHAVRDCLLPHARACRRTRPGAATGSHLRSRFSVIRGRSAGMGLCRLLVVMGLLVVLTGIVLQAGTLVRTQAELTALSAQAHHLGTALQLFYQKESRFPGAYPADLAADLAPYADGTELFLSAAHPEAGAAPLNRSYVRPPVRDSRNYVLGLEPRLAQARPRHCPDCCQYYKGCDRGANVRKGNFVAHEVNAEPRARECSGFSRIWPSCQPFATVRALSGFLCFGRDSARPEIRSGGRTRTPKKAARTLGFSAKQTSLG